jgi:hypothetical protein
MVRRLLAMNVMPYRGAPFLTALPVSDGAFATEANAPLSSAASSRDTRSAQPKIRARLSWEPARRRTAEKFRAAARRLIQVGATWRMGHSVSFGGPALQYRGIDGSPERFNVASLARSRNTSNQSSYSIFQYIEKDLFTP